MRFGGHETFAIREGWLARGLNLLESNPQALSDDFAEDQLGVGKNMAKSIRHWVVATGLAERQGSSRGKTGTFAITDFGQLLWERDRHFLDPATWWMIHINLVNTPEHAESWDWFFNNWNHRRFDKAVCVENLRRFIIVNNRRCPNIRTLDRDIGCLLASYSRSMPAARIDPEDASESPLQELGLLNHFRGSGYYKLVEGHKDIPASVFGYCVSRALQGEDGPDEFSLTELERMRGGPGRAFGINAEAIYDLVNKYVANGYGSMFRVSGLAGQRVIRIHLRGSSLGTEKGSLDWAKLAHDKQKRTAA
jgi:hypothetical protein